SSRTGSWPASPSRSPLATREAAGVATGVPPTTWDATPSASRRAPARSATTRDGSDDMSDDQANAAHPNVTAGSSTTGEVDHVLTTTRAVRRRLDLDRPVPIDVVERCI